MSFASITKVNASTYQTSDKIEVKGYVNASMIYTSEEQDIFSEYKQIPFETSVPLSVPVCKDNIKCQCKIESQSSGYNIEGNTKVNIRDVLKISCSMISEENIWEALGGNKANSLANGISKVEEFNSDQVSLLKLYSNFDNTYINYFGNIDTLKTNNEPYNCPFTSS